ncbi:uncharacterized protein LOC116030667 [Ipomoea triloba]|uniref:uncharacterized protein LOC116030667 n=1 Tax=Ipomoea triloba TaxID=35885 RepID=UPI00125D98C0|nr:uncharacterized protein LOC116030667 [Ipomoea triloba]
MSSSPSRVGVTTNPNASTSLRATGEVSSSAPLNPMPIRAVAALPQGLQKASGLFEDIGRPTGLHSKILAPELEEAQHLLGPAAEIYIPRDRYIFEPPSGGYVGAHLQSIRYGFRIPVSPFASLFFRYFALSPGQLLPNSHRLLTYFQTICTNYGFDLTMNLFLQFYLVIRVGTTSPSFIQISQRGDHKTFDGLVDSLKRWKPVFLFVRLSPHYHPFDFPLTWGSSFFKCLKKPPPSKDTTDSVEVLLDLGLLQVNEWSNLAALKAASLLHEGAATKGDEPELVPEEEEEVEEEGEETSGKAITDDPNALPLSQDVSSRHALLKERTRSRASSSNPIVVNDSPTRSIEPPRTRQTRRVLPPPATSSGSKHPADTPLKAPPAKKVALGLEADADEGIAQGAFPVHDWLDKVIFPKDAAYYESYSTEKIFEGVSRYLYRALAVQSEMRRRMKPLMADAELVPTLQANHQKSMKEVDDLAFRVGQLESELEA